MIDIHAGNSRLRAGAHICGVQVSNWEPRADDRGSFTEIFCSDWGLNIDPAQWSVVCSEPRVLRGVYLHLRHDEYIGVISGSALIGLRDLRRGSRTEGVWSLYELDGEAPAESTS